MSERFQTSYNSTYSNPHGGDTSYQQNYLHKEMIKSRFKAMREAFGVIEEEYNGCVSSEEVLILVSMFNLGSAKARMGRADCQPYCLHGIAFVFLRQVDSTVASFPVIASYTE